MTPKKNLETSLSPSHPFNETLCHLAVDLKAVGLKWIPRVGHYVWDNTGIISYPSPFPNRIYFIFNINRFLDIFQSIDRMTEQIVWLPAWHQARAVCVDLKINDTNLMDEFCRQGGFETGKDLETIYRIMLSSFQNKKIV